MANIFNKIIKSSIYSLVFLMPLFWLPFSFEAFEFNKQYLLFFLASLALFSWIGKMIMAGEIRFKKTPLDIFVAGFLFIAVLSAIFSVDKNSSIFGFYGRFSDSLISLLSMGALYFLITNNIDIKKIPGLLKTFLWSGFFVILTSYFSIFGVWQKLSFLPKIMSQNIFNPVSGSMEGLAIYLTALLVFLTGLVLIKNLKFKNFLVWTLWILSLGLLVIIDFDPAWLILSASFVIFLSFSLWKRIFKDNVNRLLAPIFLIVVAAIGFTVDFSISPAGGQLPREQVLDQGASLRVAFGSAASNVKTGFLGTGIGTFNYDFAKEKPASFNQNRLWQIRFDRAGSYIQETMATMGFLGLLSLFSLLAMFFLISYFLLSAKTQSSELLLPLITTSLAIAISQFFYYQNTVLGFMFWLILGLSVVSWQKPIKEKVISFKNFPELNLVFTTVLIILGIGLAAGYYFAGRFYLADTAFIQSKYEKAVELNPFQSQYRTILARFYLAEALKELQKPAGERNEPIFQQRAAQAIDMAKSAATKGPGQVAAFETMGMVYRDINTAAQGAKDWAIKSFEQAIFLEPTNPILHTELAKIYMSDNLAKAKEELQKAKQLKPDYADVKIQEAVVSEIEGDVKGAINILEQLVLSYPFNADFRFQLGRLYFNNNQADDAIAVFKTVIQISPNYSNALYSLGLAYQKKGNTVQAKNYFEKVLELNPENKDVQAKLKSLDIIKGKE